MSEEALLEALDFVPALPCEFAASHGKHGPVETRASYVVDVRCRFGCEEYELVMCAHCFTAQQDLTCYFCKAKHSPEQMFHFGGMI